ncbi:MAG: hypothetical protein M1812_000946 [Candelaria pacifica]|nr:MAG: hypothetical protein M1812_000946 [Candelaria pacifica]
MPDSTGEWVDGDGYISDESSFYGNDDLRLHLEIETSNFSPSTYWSTQHLSLSSIATSNLALAARQAAQKANVKLYNPFEGQLSARQLTESVPEFLTRLPPLTSQASEVGPWIWVANPHSTKRPIGENLAELKRIGEESLEDFMEEKRRIEGEMKGKAKGTITRRLTPLVKGLQDRISEVAREKGCTSGKWMLFPMPEHVNKTWSLIATAVVNNELGSTAKIATDEGKGDRVSRLICVYTDDFSDTDDVKRVIAKLVEMGLVERSKSIYYKCDAYTYLGISSGNEYGLKASLYASKDVLTAVKK